MLHADASRCTAGSLLCTPAIYMFKLHAKHLSLNFPPSPPIRYQKQRCTQAVCTSHSIVYTTPIQKNASKPALGKMIL